MANQERFKQVVRIAKGAVAGFLTLAAVSCAPQEQITATSEPIRIGSATPSALFQEAPTIPPRPTLPINTDIPIYISPTTEFTPRPPTIFPTATETQEMMKKEFKRILFAGTSTPWLINRDYLRGGEIKSPTLGDRWLVARGEMGETKGVRMEKVIQHIKEMKDLKQFDTLVFYAQQNNLIDGDTPESIYNKITNDLLPALKTLNPDITLLVVETPPTSVDNFASQKARDRLNQMLDEGDKKGLFHLVRVVSRLAVIGHNPDGTEIVTLIPGKFRDGLHPTLELDEKNNTMLKVGCGAYEIIDEIRKTLDSIIVSVRPTKTPTASLRNN